MSKKTRAPEVVLGELHKFLAETMLKDLRGGNYTPAYLSVVAKFLKDNGIEALPETSEALQALSQALPDLGDYDEDGMVAQ